MENWKSEEFNLVMNGGEKRNQLYLQHLNWFYNIKQEIDEVSLMIDLTNPEIKLIVKLLEKHQTGG